MKTNLLSIETSLIILTILGFTFIVIGHLYTTKTSKKQNYIVGNRDESVFSLTASLTSSALGAWILFGPASASTWGGIGAVLGYSLGTAAPMLFFLNFGPKIRKEFPNGLTLTNFIKKRFGKGILKISLFLILFYLTIFLIAEITAISYLLNFISNIPLWISSGITLIICLIYVLRGGFKLSIITDKYQFIFIILIIFVSIFIILNSLNFSSYYLINEKKPFLLSKNYLPNYTAGLTFFIAVASTNLFHQGNWQRIFSAKNNRVLKKSLIFSFSMIILIVFWMGYSGLISYSLNSNVLPDLAFFELILSNKNKLTAILILILALVLTFSTVDTLINSISSTIIVDGSEINKFIKGDNVKQKAHYVVLVLSILIFIFASKGYSILYLFLLADLLCCSAVVIIFYGFFKNNISIKLAKICIFSGLLVGLLFFPTQNFNTSFLVGGLISIDHFNTIIINNLLFISFISSLLVPSIIISIYSLRNSFK